MERTSCHYAGACDHQFTIVAAEYAEEPEDDDGAGEDAEADGEAADADADGILAVNIEGLGGPEEEDGEEIGAGYKGYNEREDEDARGLLQARGEHGVGGEFGFPYAEGDEHEEANEEGGENVGAFPLVLSLVVSVIGAFV